MTRNTEKQASKTYDHPLSNTRLHWFQFTVLVQHLSEVTEMLCRCFGPLDDEKGGRFNVRYNRGSFWSAGGGVFRFLADDGGNGGVGEAFVSLPGSLLDSVGADAQFEFFQALDSRRLGLPFYAVGRFDAAFDDYAWVVRPRAVQRRYVETGCFGPMRTWKGNQSGCIGRASGSGFTVGQAGKSGGGVTFSMYDKFVESGGLIDACRYEARFFGDRADMSWQEVMCGCYSTEEWLCRLGKLVAGAADFYVPASMADHLKRRVLAPFMVKLRHFLGEARYAARQEVVDDLARTKDHIEKSYAGAIAAVVLREDRVHGAGAGDAWIAELLRKGKRALSDRWLKLLAAVPPKALREVQDGLPF